MMTTTFQEMKNVLKGKAEVYGGPWRGYVENRDDPEQSGRIKARIEPLHGKSPEEGGSVPTSDLPWAYPMDRQVAPSHQKRDGEDNPGSLSVPYEESWVWIYFDRGNPRVPLYQSGARPKGVVPDRFKGQSDEADRTANENTVDDKFTEKGPSTGEYPETIGWTLKSGIVVEYDDSDSPRIFRYHPSGWWEQVDSEGNKNEHTPGNRQDVTEGNQNTHVGEDRVVLVKGDEDEEIRGDETRLVQGATDEEIQQDELRTIGGNVEEDIGQDETRTIGGSIEETVSQDETRSIGGSQQETIGGDLTRSVAGLSQVTVGGERSVNAGGNMTLNSGGVISLNASAVIISAGAVSIA